MSDFNGKREKGKKKKDHMYCEFIVSVVVL